VFNIVSGELNWEGGLEDDSRPKLEEGLGEGGEKCGEERNKVGALELLEYHYPGTKVQEGWWGAGKERRGFWICDKAGKMLGWKHE
jgi:hypothetical protein